MEEGDVILCTVEKVTNTITFVRLPNGKEATLVSSEIAPGRIKHLRQYVVPNKKIVCKVLQISGDHIHLSLRRVNGKEKKEVMQKFKIEKAAEIALKQILEKDFEKVVEKILKDFESLPHFIEALKKDQKIVEKYISKEKSEQILKLTQKSKGQKIKLKQILKMTCLEENGVSRIKKVLKVNNKNVSITYVSAGVFALTLEAEDFKSGKKELQEILENLEKKAKEEKCEFYSKEEKS